MRFTKIKYNGKEVRLAWQESVPSGGLHEHGLTSKALPTPEFVGAFAAFVSLARQLLELPIVYEDGMRCIGVSLNTEEESGRRGVVATCLKDLKDVQAPLVLNTPHQKEPEDSDGYSVGWVVAIEMLEHHAAAFVGGVRAQGDLFPPADEDDEDEDEGDES